MEHDIFSHLQPESTTLTVLLDLQRRYPLLDVDELASYRERVKLRIGLLSDFATNNNLPVNTDLICNIIKNTDATLLTSICDELALPQQNIPAAEKGWVYLFNGGPATGKSTLAEGLDGNDVISLDRDRYFPRLTPYNFLKQQRPEQAVHAVVCEAILYNECDAYDYALSSGAKNLLVDGTMSYVDIGVHMITNAQAQGYKVKVINVDSDIDVAIRRAKERAAKTGKTINIKLLYESHVRCAHNFFEYHKLADVTENWYSGQGAKARLIANSEGVYDKVAYKNLRNKGELPLDKPSWPANFSEYQ